MGLCGLASSISSMPPTPPKYNKDQWIESFTDEMSRLHPHTKGRVLTTICAMAWNSYGVKGADPYKAAREWSKSMDRTA